MLKEFPLFISRHRGLPTDWLLQTNLAVDWCSNNDWIGHHACQRGRQMCLSITNKNEMQYQSSTHWALQRARERGKGKREREDHSNHAGTKCTFLAGKVSFHHADTRKHTHTHTHKFASK